MKYAVIYEKSRTGYSAYAPDLPGCVAAGSTLEETGELMRGAIEMHLEGMREDGDPIPRPTSVADCIEIAPAAKRIKRATVGKIRKATARREEKPKREARGRDKKRKKRPREREAVSVS
jgi:predicted RNase H-like HicB family nuclease